MSFKQNMIDRFSYALLMCIMCKQKENKRLLLEKDGAFPQNLRFFPLGLQDFLGGPFDSARNYT